MNRRVFVIAMICAGLAAGGAALFVSFRSGAEPETVPVADAPPREAATSAPAPEERASPREAPRTARRAPAATPPADREVERSGETLELGTLRIESDVAGAQVFIDRQFIGITPLTAENIKPGTHQLNVTAEGFEGFAQAIDVEPGPRDLVFRFREVRLDAKLAVIHKHRMGSCRGQLVASADGIRYETSHHDDAFSASLDDLETFHVDYEDKNLRIKLRKGRQFNFTDPDGNADRLFVFHRDVEKVRMKVARVHSIAFATSSACPLTFTLSQR